MRSPWLYILLVFYSWTGLYAQTPPLRFERITTENGLPSDYVANVLQDHLGFIWIATRSGLVKYDGYTFQHYFPDPLDPGSISGADVKALCEDREGTLWVGTYADGLNRYDRATDSFTHFRHDPENSRSLSGNMVWSILEDSERTLWIGTRNGIDRLDRETSTFSRYDHDRDDPEKLPYRGINVIYELPSEPGTVLIGTDAGLYVYDREKRYFHPFSTGSTQAETMAGSCELALRGSKWHALGGLPGRDPSI